MHILCGYTTFWRVSPLQAVRRAQSRRLRSRLLPVRFQCWVSGLFCFSVRSFDGSSLVKAAGGSSLHREASLCLCASSSPGESQLEAPASPTAAACRRIGCVHYGRARLGALSCRRCAFGRRPRPWSRDWRQLHSLGGRADPAERRLEEERARRRSASGGARLGPTLF